MKVYQPEAKKWVKALVARHIGRLKLDDAPEAGTEQYDDAALIWDEAFAVVNASASEADKASRRVASAPTPWWREQLPAVLKAIDLERASNFAQPAGDGVPGAASDRLTALAASASCEWCQGMGLVMVYHRDYDGKGPSVMVTGPDGQKFRRQTQATIACRCDYGRWILAQAGKSDDKTIARRLGGIEAVEAGRCDWSADPSTARHLGQIRAETSPY